MCWAIASCWYPPEAFEKDLQFDEALDLIPRLQRLARAHGKRLAVKFSNTLVVKNHARSSPMKHVHVRPAAARDRHEPGEEVSRAHGRGIPISFSAGLDAHNMADGVAMNFVPVTTCTDLLRPGGYARLIRYLENLGAKMREVGATRLPDFVLRPLWTKGKCPEQGEQGIADSLRGQFVGAESGQIARVETWLKTDVLSPLNALAAAPAWRAHPRSCAGRSPASLKKRFPTFPPAMVDALRGDHRRARTSLVDAAGVLNTPILVKEATENPRYAWERNKGVPRKIGSKLWLYDCINCDKCVPVCPNVANFVYETNAVDIAYDNFELTPRPPQRVPGGVFKVAKAHQLANYADACNDCGNCDVFCPEDGGPYIENPAFSAASKPTGNMRAATAFTSLLRVIRQPSMALSRARLIS